jgi:hypothetical protein
MSQDNYFSHRLLYSLSSEYITRMHLADTANENTNHPPEPQPDGVRQSFAGHLVAFFRKTLKRPA